jgi:RHS repeat-associated protein
MNCLKKLLSITGLWLALALAAHAGTPTVTYIYTDPQETPLAETDAQGNITATFDYRPYGSQALGTPPKGPGYTGHVNDPDTGFVYMQARYYDPSIGRFVSVDPIGPAPGALFGFNRFKYAANNPSNVIDPDGRQDCRSCERSYGFGVAIALRNDPASMAIVQRAEQAATVSGTGAMEGMALGSAAVDFVNTGEYSSEAAATAVISATVTAITHGRAKNKLGPDSQADGQHSTFKRDEHGKITNTATYEPNSQNPSGFQELKRVDVTGKSHTNPDGAVVPTPHVSEAGVKGVRPALPEELPNP